jgi:hypothetical protein
MNGYHKYGRGIQKLLRPILTTRTPEEYRALSEAYYHHLADLEGPRQAGWELTKRETFIALLFRGFSEIATSYERLRDIEIYIRRFPYRDTGVSRVRHLQYHVENYLNEVYILKERVRVYLDNINKWYRRSEHYRKVQPELELLRTFISEPLENLVNLRGEHVHARRFSDDQLDRLTTLELLASSAAQNFQSPAEHNFWSSFLQEEYKSIRKKWTERIKSNNDATEKLLDAFFELLHRTIFDDDELISPV